MAKVINYDLKTKESKILCSKFNGDYRFHFINDNELYYSSTNSGNYKINLDDSKKILASTITSNQRNNIRNYAIICLFLNCCLRLSELVGLNLTDIKLDEKTIKIRGKGDKERILYLNDATIESIEEYLKVRTTLPKENYNYNALFLSEQKKRISRRCVQHIVTETITKTINELSSELPSLYREIITLNDYLLFTKNNMGISDKDKKQF